MGNTETLTKIGNLSLLQDTLKLLIEGQFITKDTQADITE